MSWMTICWLKLTNNRTHSLLFPDITGSNYIIHFTPYTCKHNFICHIVVLPNSAASSLRDYLNSPFFSAPIDEVLGYMLVSMILFFILHFRHLGLVFFSVYANFHLKIKLSLQLTPAISMLSKQFQNNGVTVQMKNTFDIDFFLLIV